MNYYFCVNKFTIDLLEISQYLTPKLGAKLHADLATDIVNGAITANHYPAGEKVAICWGGHDLSKVPGEHSCLIIETYEYDKDPDGLFQKSKIRKKLVDKVKLDKECDNFCKMKKLKKMDKKEVEKDGKETNIG